MTETLTALSLILAAVASMYGWGASYQLAFQKTDSPSLSYRSILGLAIFIFAGGILNLTSNANDTAINLLFFFGLLFCTGSIITERKAILKKLYTEWRYLGIGLAFSLSSGLYLCDSLLPSDFFNYHDDFHSYFPRIPFMLSSGSLGGNEYSLLGADSLGAQSFAQALVVSNFGFEYIYAFDAVFCLTLTIFALSSLCARLTSPISLSVLAISCPILVHTQQVNSSSVYSTTLLVVGLSLGLLSLIANQPRLSNPKTVWLATVPLILMCQSLIAFKTLSAFYATFFFIGVFATLMVRLKYSRKETAMGFLLSGASLIAITLPWFAIHSENYAAIFDNISESTASAEHLFMFPLDKIFSFNEWIWGGNTASYLILTIALLILFITPMRRKAVAARENIQTSDVSIITCGAALLTLAVSLTIFEYQMAIRYFLPLLPACLGVGLVATNSAFSMNEGDDDKRKSIVTGAVSLLAFTTLYLLFLPANTKKISILNEHNTTLFFFLSPPSTQYMQRIWSPEHKDSIESMQNHTEESSKIFSWTSTPFLFDFDRNIINNFASSHTLAPWYSLQDLSSEEIKSILLEDGYRYILWEYQGFGLLSNSQLSVLSKHDNVMWRQYGTRIIDLKNKLVGIADTSLVLTNPQGYALIDISLPPIAQKDTDG
jgi:hypothetical protein